MSLGSRLKLARGNTSQKAFAAELGVHENTVSNAERRDSAPQDYLVKIAQARNVNLNWLLTGRGAMFVNEATGGSLLQEKHNIALVDALRVLYGNKYNSVSLETRDCTLHVVRLSDLGPGPSEQYAEHARKRDIKRGYRAP